MQENFKKTEKPQDSILDTVKELEQRVFQLNEAIEITPSGENRDTLISIRDYLSKKLQEVITFFDEKLPLNINKNIIFADLSKNKTSDTEKIEIKENKNFIDKHEFIPDDEDRSVPWSDK